ncbi:MAG: M16 family metallopeptidase [Syntrophobacteria bacterium]
MDNESYQKTVLDNGIRVVSERIPQFHSACVGIWVNVGSRDEAENESGLTHFIEHMLFKGTKRRSALDIAKELDAVGGMANAFTTKENTCFHAKVLDTHLEVVVDILADLFLYSVFDPRELEREREVILQEIHMVEDTPDEYIHILFNQTFWDGNPLARPILGNGQTLQNFTREMAMAYFNHAYHPDRIVLSAAGNVDHHRLVDLIEPSFAGMERRPYHLQRIPPSTTSRVSLAPRELEQVHFCLGTEGTSIVEEDRYSCSILNVILGGSMSSRLFQEVRERHGLAYSIYSFLNSHTDAGVLGVYAAVRQENARKTIELVAKELQRLKREPISAAELRDAKEHIKGGIYLSAEHSDNRMSRLAKNEFNFGRVISYREIESGLERVTAEDVQALAQRIFRPELCSLVLLGPVEGLGIDLGFLDP